MTIRQLLTGRLAAFGYRHEVSADAREERVIAPDGTIALLARRACEDCQRLTDRGMPLARCPRHFQHRTEG
jgi:hypothetical protein